MIFDKLFQLMAEKQASDLFISAGAPIHIKIQGTTLPINQQVMEPSMIQRMGYELMGAEQIAQFESAKEMNLSFGRRDLGNFRVNLFWQRNSVAIVVRFIQGDIPALSSLGLPATLADMLAAFRERDWPQVRSLGHQVKGAGGGFGYPRISEIGADIEIAAAEPVDSAELAAQLERFRLTCTEVVETLADGESDAPPDV